ncbi:MAG TPA: NUDIX hydrolase [Usitatibacteraceae bacterium]
MNTAELISSLSTHRSLDSAEEKHRLDTIFFVQRNAASWWRRSTIEGHITASAWVRNRAGTHALLLHHAQLDRWLQPGGHLDESDASPAHAALREAREESGIPGLKLADEGLIDVDVHPIPARRKSGVMEPAHLHYDLRYLVSADRDDVVLSEESLGFQWLSVIEVAHNAEPSIARLARKSLSR